jgi:hypothetical protein
MRKLSITAGGGMGDQICAEPVIRYMKETWCRNDDIVVMTQYPDAFKHLDVTCYDRNVTFDESRSTVSTHPVGDDPYVQVMCFHRTHPVDYISIRLLKRMLPLRFRRIRIPARAESLEKIKKLVKYPYKTVLVHPGSSWQSKTIPAEIWNSYIWALKKYHDVVVIGRNFKTEKGEQRGVVNVSTTGCLDLIDKLNFDELCAIISLCPVLISNDSAPVHIAGAYDNWIGLIPTCKHPDYILPYRDVQKSKALYRMALFDRLFDFDPLNIADVPIATVSEDLMRIAVPTIEQVMWFVDGCFRNIKDTT